MSKQDRLSLVRAIASRANRIICRCADCGLSVSQTRRALRRTCPRLHLSA